MRRRIKKSHIIAAILLILCAAALVLNSSLSKKLTDRTLARSWAADRFDYARISCFLHRDLRYDQLSVIGFHTAVDAALEKESLEPASKNARLWIDCWSAEGEIALSSGGNSLTVRAFYTGGDFFQFHPLPMVSGWYYSGLDVNDDLVILDKEAAWKLFGGYDLTGMAVTVAGYPCVVAGVADLPQTEAERSSYGDSPTVYLSYSLLYKLGMGESVTCYEALIPDLVDGFAEKIIADSVTVQEGMCEITVNSDRYTVPAAYSFFRGFLSRGQRTGEVSLPWWENASRYMDSVSAMVLLFAALCLVFPAAVLISLIIKAYKKRGAALKAARLLLDRAMDKIRERKSFGRKEE